MDAKARRRSHGTTHFRRTASAHIVPPRRGRRKRRRGAARAPARRSTAGWRDAAGGA